MKKEILSKLKSLKYRYKGIEIVGVTGSVLNSKEPKDIDIVYKIEEKFLKEVDPFKFFTYLTFIKNDLSKIFNKSVDLIDITTLNKVAKKYMDIEYV